MDQITLRNFRCFQDEQIARLAPLTLLVGENSTGKTSFLALIRALWDVAYRYQVPNFKEAPYDLGSFDEIAHHRGARGSQANTFEAGFTSTPTERGVEANRIGGTGPYRFQMTFGKKGTVPVPVRRRLDHGDYWIEEHYEESQSWRIGIGTPRGAWQQQRGSRDNIPLDFNEYLIGPLFYSLRSLFIGDNATSTPVFKAMGDSPKLTSAELEKIQQFIFHSHIGGLVDVKEQRPFASAPVRSKPSRTYDPSRPTPDPEGDYVPTYLASLYFQNKKIWTSLKDRLESFGQDAGLFDEISIKPLGKRDVEPFQVQVRKFGGGLKGPRRNLVDVGYGVSQVLPVIAELLRQDAPPLFLLQQPEVHLHPSAQAALGSLFCRVASRGRQLIVETHSDHLLDRVRMDVRDSRTKLKPDDVSILFFQRGNLDIHIHSIRFDEEGNVLGAPEGYRQFFMDETQRSLEL